MSNKLAHAYFTKVYNAIKLEFPFNLSWSNKVGGFDGIIHGPDAPIEIPLASIGKTITSDGRRILIMNTGLGLAAVYERFAAVSPERQVYCLITTSALLQKTEWFPIQGDLSLDDLRFTLGGDDYTKNIGWRLKDIFDSYAKLKTAA